MAKESREPAILLMQTSSAWYVTESPQAAAVMWQGGFASMEGVYLGVLVKQGLHVVLKPLEQSRVSDEAVFDYL